MFDMETREAVAGFADGLDVPPAALLAVAEVESGGKTGTVVDGRFEPLIRFEGHYFHMLLPETLRARAVREGLASPRAGAVANPASQVKRYELLGRAKAIDEVAALSSCSWGVGQVMGAHWRALGFDGVQALVALARRDPAGQIELMTRFIRNANLIEPLRRLDWAAFARVYNGPAYRRNRYDEKLAAAYRRNLTPGADEGPRASVGGLRAGDRGAAVKDLQRRLDRIGYRLKVDGDFGPSTEKALRDFQRDRGLTVDGVAGPSTLSALELLADFA